MQAKDMKKINKLQYHLNSVSACLIFNSLPCLLNLYALLHGLASYIIRLPGAPLPHQASFL